jgi:predicted RNA-binding protein associated with RNAse of E/G family
MGERVRVEKLDPRGEVTVTWTGQVLHRTAAEVVVEAVFTRGPYVLGEVTLRPGDRFVEHFYADRWYNVFAIYAGEDGAFKGWYCNITRPAEIGPAPEGGLRVRAVDLALDYFRTPDGQEFVLDDDEFTRLALAPADAAACRAALAELRALAAAGTGPFAAPEASAPAGPA